jgi:hypothetical protein
MKKYFSRYGFMSRKFHFSRIRGCLQNKNIHGEYKIKVQQKFISKPWRNFVAVRCFAGHENHYQPTSSDF